MAAMRFLACFFALSLLAGAAVARPAPFSGLAQTPGVWRSLDEWLRHRLRAIHLKHWKRGSTIYRELLNLGASEHVAKRVAGNSRCWWRNSAGELNRVLTIAYFDKLGVPRLS